MLLSLGYRFSIAGLGSLGVALEVGRFGLPYPAVVPSFVVGGLCPGFSFSCVGRTWTNLSLGLHIDLPCVVHCGAQSMPELGRSLVY